MRSIIFLLFMCLSLPAFALDVLQGSIVSAGASTNNLTTAAPFQVPVGPIVVQCNAAAYIAVGSSADVTVTSATGLEVSATALYDTSTTDRFRVVAVIPKSGSATCKVFRVQGGVARRGGSGGSYTPIATEHAAHDLTAVSITLSKSGGVGVACTNASCNASFGGTVTAGTAINSSGSMSTGSFTASGTVTGSTGAFGTVNVSGTITSSIVKLTSATSLPTCSGTFAGQIRYIVDVGAGTNALYFCNGSTWVAMT